jgi:hypothetical protein
MEGATKGDNMSFEFRFTYVSFLSVGFKPVFNVQHWSNQHASGADRTLNWLGFEFAFDTSRQNGE